MKQLETLCNDVLACCERLLTLCEPPLDEKGQKDIHLVIEGTQRFLTMLSDYNMTDEMVNNLRQNKQFERMGQFSHDIRAPLGRMIGFSELLLFHDGNRLIACHKEHLLEIVRLNDEIEAVIYENFDRDRE